MESSDLKNQRAAGEESRRPGTQHSRQLSLDEQMHFMSGNQLKSYILGLIVDRIPSMIGYFDSGKSLIYANQPFLSLLIDPTVKAMGISFSQLFPGESVDFLDNHADSALRGEAKTFEIALNAPSGGRLYLEASLTPDIDNNGIPRGFVILANDVTHRVTAANVSKLRLEQERRIHERQCELISTINHEIKNPLAIISAGARGIDKHLEQWCDENALPEVPEGVTRRITRIARSVQHLTRLLDTHLAAQAIEHGDLNERDKKSLDLAETIRHIAEILEEEGAPQRIKLQMPEQMPYWGHPYLLEQLVTNLLMNALKYSPSEQPISLHLEPFFRDDAEKPWIRLVISDNGIGIAKEEQERLFDKFFRASNTNGRPGNGIGLWLCKRSVELHGGEISVDSEIGHGTAITITLPPSQPQNPSQPVPGTLSQSNNLGGPI